MLKMLRPYLHLRHLDREHFIFPVVPIHPLTTGLAVKVQAIQVGIVAVVVPPGTFIIHSTVASVVVTITILGGKCHTTMITKRISSSA